jgi:cobalt-zinc-cadmium efflux system membrane fusion protein
MMPERWEPGFSVGHVDPEGTLREMTDSGTDQPPRERRALPMYRQLRILGGVAIIAFVGVIIEVGWDSFFTREVAVSQTPNASQVVTFRPSSEQLAGLIIKPVERVAFRTETVTEGYIAIDDNLSTPIFSPLSGRVTKLMAKLGDYVEKGTPMMEVEASEMIQAQNDLIAAKSTLNSTEAQLGLAQANENRQHELYGSEGAALRDWQQSKVELATAEGNFHNAQTALDAVRNRLSILGRSDDEITAFESASVTARPSPEAVVRAPIAGTVIQRQVGLGQYIQAAAANPVYLIGNLSTAWLVANVRETDAPRIHLGDVVEVHVLAYPDKVFKATISYVASSIDPLTHRLTVRADVDNHDGALKLQMFATFSIITGTAVMAPGIPQSAVVYEGETARVWVTGPDGALSLRQIRAGRTNGGMIEVVQGLAAGEMIVTSGALFIDRAATSG